MIPRAFRLCELFGIPIRLDFSLAILLLMFTTGGGGPIGGIFCALALLLSITAHELGHALTARYFGYYTNDITLSLLGGCASLISLPRKPSQEFLTAAAGPAVSFVLSFAGVCATAMFVEGGLWNTFLFMLSQVLASFNIYVDLNFKLAFSHSTLWIVEILVYWSVMNAILGIFNLLPGFPMDGGRIFRSSMRAFMPRTRATYIAMIVGRVFAVFLALSAFNRIVTGAGWGFVTLLIAWMIWKEGHREYMQTLQESSWGGGWDFSARISPPPYGGDEDETEIRRDR